MHSHDAELMIRSLMGLPSLATGASEERFARLSREDFNETASSGVTGGGLTPTRMSS